MEKSSRDEREVFSPAMKMFLNLRSFDRSLPLGRPLYSVSFSIGA